MVEGKRKKAYRHKYYWMEIDKDNCDLPVCVADTAEELGALRRVNPSTIINCINWANRSGKKCKYIKIPRGAEDDD